MPVKDALPTAELAIRHLCAWEVPFSVWNDRSTEENTVRLHELQRELGFTLIDVAALTDHPSPNYLLLLQRAQSEALTAKQHVVIVESDVLVKPDTLTQLCHASQTQNTGLVAAITHDTDGHVNFPYLYAQEMPAGHISTNKRLSFCCTLLTYDFLKAFPFSNLDPDKDWFDVTISKAARKAGFNNILLTNAPVTHLPHASRPWKQLKYTHPLKYYWLKLIHGRDKI